MNVLSGGPEAASAATTVVHKVSAVAGTAGAASAIIFGLTANEFAAIGGLVVAILAFVTNLVITFYFKNEERKDRRALMERNTIMSLPSQEV